MTTESNQDASAYAQRDASPWLTIKEACLVAKVSAKLLYRECRAGRLRHARIGFRRDIRIHRDWIDQWLEASAAVVEMRSENRSTLFQVSQHIQGAQLIGNESAACVNRDYRDLVIEGLADSEAALRKQVATLVEIVADLTFENTVLRCVFEREFVERIHGTAALRRTRCTLYRQHQRQHGVNA